MEPRRIALAVILMAAVLIITPILFPTPKSATGVEVTNTVLGDSATIATARSGDVARTDSLRRAAGETLTAMGATSASADSTPTRTIDTTAVTTARATYRTTNRGAALIGAQMQQYRTLTKGASDDLVQLANAGDRLIAFRLVTPGDTIALDRHVFQTTRGEANGTTSVRYDATVAQRAVSITYSFLPDSYRVNIAANVAGAPASSYLLVELPPGFHSSEADTTEDHTHLAYAYKPDQQSAKAIAFGSLDPGEREIIPGPLTWVVAKNKYFLLGLLTPQGQPGFAELDVTGGVRASKAATRAQATVITPLRDGAASFELYVGPQEFKRLVAVGRDFETSNPYGGWIQGMVQPFATMVISMLLWMKARLGLSYGWILVVFGVAIRIILWPLNQRAMRSSTAMQRLQPELQAIQTKHKGDPQKMQLAMSQLYKEHNMSPFSSISGCLPMLIPMPVFFALFFVFQNTIEFRGVSFLWLPDISIKDPIYLLPILVAITQILLSWISMRGMKSNEQQKMMMYMMPVMMLFIFLNMASGLNLYYLVQNLASLPQQWLISKERGKATALLVRG